MQQCTHLGGRDDYSGFATESAHKLEEALDHLLGEVEAAVLGKRNKQVAGVSAKHSDNAYRVISSSLPFCCARIMSTVLMRSSAEMVGFVR
jgi:hypothetical protein